MPEIFVEVPEATAEREYFDPGLVGASAEALHAAGTGAIRIDCGIDASERGGEGRGGPSRRDDSRRGAAIISRSGMVMHNEMTVLSPRPAARTVGPALLGAPKRTPAPR